MSEYTNYQCPECGLVYPEGAKHFHALSGSQEARVREIIKEVTGICEADQHSLCRRLRDDLQTRLDAEAKTSERMARLVLELTVDRDGWANKARENCVAELAAKREVDALRSRLDALRKALDIEQAELARVYDQRYLLAKEKDELRTKLSACEKERDDARSQLAASEWALRALHDAVYRFVIATDDVDVRGAMALARKSLGSKEQEA